MARVLLKELITPSLVVFLLLTIFAATASQANPNKPDKTAAGNEDSSNKGAVHLVPHSSAEIKQIFTYFPYPDIPAQYRFAKISGTGIYRLTIDSHGNVTEIKILKRIGVFGDWPADVTALKTLIRWRATPGPVRTVDIPWSITPGYRFITNEDRISQGINCSVFRSVRKRILR